MTRLLGWSADNRIPDESYARLQSHPGYRQAVTTLANRMLAAAAKDKALDGIAKDAGRYVATVWALYLNVTGGLTLPRLKDICATSGLLSPGRARAVLLYLRYLGYVTPLANSDRREPVRYAPTPALTDAWRHIVNENLEAARIIEPAVERVLDRLEDPATLGAYMRHIGEGFLVAAKAGLADQAFLRVFLHRHGGMQIVYWIVAAGDPDDEFPPRRPVPLSIAAIARQLRVSRVHVKRILNEAAREGYATFDEAGCITLTENARAQFRYLISTLLIGFLILAAKTIRDVPTLAGAGRQGRGQNDDASISAEL